MASKTDILNRAVIKLGGERISNYETTNTKNARVMNEIYETVRDAVLQACPWNFAIKKTNLAADPSAPEYGFSAKYSLPHDCLQLLDVQDDPDYRASGGYIEINHTGPLYIRYIARIKNAGVYPPLFIDALAARLAYEGCEAITQSNTKKDILFREYQVLVSAAYAADAIEDPSEELPEDEWLEARV